MSNLEEGQYVYTDNGIEKVHYCFVNGEKELVTPKSFVYANVPNFVEFKNLEEDTVSLPLIRLWNVKAQEVLRKAKGMLTILKTIQAEQTTYSEKEIKETILKIEELLK
jgi:hypothetical protein